MIANLPLLFFLSAGSAYVALLLSLVRFRRLDKGGKALAVLCIANALEFTVTLSMSLMKMRNLHVGNAYRPIELALIAAVFWYMVPVPIVRRWSVLLALLFLIIWIVDLMLPLQRDGINANMAMVQRVFAALISVIVLHQGLRLPGPSPFARPVFWVGTAILVYASGTFFVLGFSNELMSMGLDQFTVTWQINWFLLTVANILYMKGLLCKPQVQP